MMAFAGYFFRDSLASAFGLILMGFLLIDLNAFAMGLKWKFIQARKYAQRNSGNINSSGGTRSERSTK